MLNNLRTKEFLWDYKCTFKRLDWIFLQISVSEGTITNTEGHFWISTILLFEKSSFSLNNFLKSAGATSLSTSAIKRQFIKYKVYHVKLYFIFPAFRRIKKSFPRTGYWLKYLQYCLKLSYSEASENNMLKDKIPLMWQTNNDINSKKYNCNNLKFIIQQNTVP